MKLNKTMGRVATTLVATAMLASLAAPAYAYEVVTDSNTGSSITTEKPYQEGDSFYITKYLTKDAKTMVPKIDFEFEVTPVTGVSGTRNGAPLKNGIPNAVTPDASEGKASFAPGETLDQSTELFTKVKFNVDLEKFEETGVGVYKYSIKEKDFASGTGITKDTNTLDLYVYIANDDVNGGLKVAYTELVDPNGGEDSSEIKMDSFTNEYGKYADDLNDLVVYKVLSGDAAVMGDEFEFTVTINGETGEKYYVELGTYGVSEGNETAHFIPNGQSVVWESGKAETVTLGNNDAFKVYSLDKTDSYTVEETDDKRADYTVEIDNVKSENYTATGTLNNDKTIEFDNHKQFTTPTGIVMNVAPYALLVVVAAAGCFVFMRKRRED